MLETKTKIDNIKKASSTAQKVIKFCKIFCGIMAGITFLTGCVFIGLQGKINEAIQMAIDEGYFNYDSMTNIIGMPALREIADSKNLADGMGANIIVGGIMLILLTVVLHFLGKVFEEFKESYSPFQPGVIKNLKIVFIMITILGLNSSIVIGAVTGISFWCVIQIFEYGCDLQKQSDETL